MLLGSLRTASRHEDLFRREFLSCSRRIQDGRKSDDILVCSVIEEFGRGSPDETWIPAVASRHGVIITQDVNIHRLKAQWELCQSNKIGIFFVKPPKKGWSYWDIVRLVVRWWPEISRLAYIEHDAAKIKSF
jgi:hypothetical protein